MRGMAPQGYGLAQAGMQQQEQPLYGQAPQSLARSLLNVPPPKFNDPGKMGLNVPPEAFQMLKALWDKQSVAPSAATSLNAVTTANQPMNMAPGLGGDAGSPTPGINPTTGAMQTMGSPWGKQQMWGQAGDFFRGLPDRFAGWVGGNGSTY